MGAKSGGGKPQVGVACEDPSLDRKQPTVLLSFATIIKSPEFRPAGVPHFSRSLRKVGMCGVPHVSPLLRDVGILVPQVSAQTQGANLGYQADHTSRLGTTC
jgi:hypothetical protein